MTSNVFPAIIKATYDPSGGFPKMVQDAQSASSQIKRQFESDFGQIANLAKEALSLPRNAGGSLDLNVGQYKEAAANARAHAIALREIANAASSAQKASGDTTRATQTYVQAASAAAREAEEQARALNLTAVAHERLQAELNKTKSATDAVVTSQNRGTNAYGMVGESLRGMRQASIQSAQQIQDLGISLYSGQRASTVFAQQLPQLAFALTSLEGSANKTANRIGIFASVLSGPLGSVALVGASIGLGVLVEKLFQTEKAAEQAKFATNAMGDAQGILSNVLDITTGKISTQSNALLGLAKAQLLVARVQAQTRAAEARRGVQGIQDREFQFSGGMGGGFSVKRRDIDARDVISQQVLAGNMTAKTAVERLDNLRRAGKLTDDQFTSAATSVANLGVELENLKVYDDAGKLLDGTGGTNLLKPGKGRRKRGDGGVASLTEFGEDAGKKIANIADQFGEAPTAIVRVNKALRELDDIQSDLERRKPNGVEKILADLTNARSVVGNSLSTAFDQVVEKEQERARIQQLINTGRQREADILETLAGLGELDVRAQVEKLKEIAKGSAETLEMADATADERAKATDELAKSTAELAKLEPLAKRQLEWATKTAEQRERDAEAARRAREQIARYQSVVDGTYRSLEDLLSGGKAGDFVKSLRDQFKQLAGQNLAESLFGDTFRELRRFTERNNPQNVAVERLVETTNRSSDALTTFVDALLEQGGRIGAANDNGIGEYDGSGRPTFGGGNQGQAGRVMSLLADDIITVTGSIKKTSIDTNRYNYGQFASQTARAIINPLLKKLDDTFGVRFFGQLSGALSGVLSGYMQAGPIGAGINGLNSLFGGKGAIGSAISSLSKNLPAIGQAIQINQSLNTLFGNDERKGGKLLHTALGPVVSLLFAKKSGSTTINSTESDLSYKGSGSYKDGVLSLGSNIQSSLANIIQSLGANAGTFGVSVGKRGKDFVVDPTGQGRTKGSGVQRYKTEEEASRAALLDAIRDGAVKGIKDGAQRLLQAGKDLDAQLQKAMKFQSVFDRLDAFKDPIGSSIRTLNREFTGLISIFTEAGASAEEFAALEELYGLERAKAIKDTSESLTSSLRGLIDELTKGENGLSLRDRLSNIRADFNPMAATIRAGGTVDYDRFSELARQLIDVQRQISGSQTDYFSTFNEVLALSRQALAGQENVVSIGTANPSPFSGGADPSNASVPVVNAINAQTGELMAGFAALTAQVAQLRYGSGGSAEAAMYNPDRNYF